MTRARMPRYTRFPKPETRRMPAPIATMKLEEMERGALYMVKGGHILRYQGPYSNKDGVPTGPCLAFRVPSEGLSEPHVGYSASIDEVLHKITPGDLVWLGDRREQLIVRNLDTAEIDFAIQELVEQRRVKITKTACTKCEGKFEEDHAVVVRGKEELCMPCAMHSGSSEGVTLVFKVPS
jgi:hypothetical protein